MTEIYNKHNKNKAKKEQHRSKYITWKPLTTNSQYQVVCRINWAKFIDQNQQTTERMNDWMNDWIMNKWMNEWINECTTKWMNE